MPNDELLKTADLPPPVAATLQGAINLLEKVSREALRGASKLRKHVRHASKSPEEPASEEATALLREAADILSDRSGELHETARKLEPDPPMSKSRGMRARS